MRLTHKSVVAGKYSVFAPWSVFLWVLTALVIFVLHSASMYMGNLNQDEGWYLYAARLVSQGQIPYKDFVFTQGPVMPYVYSLAYPMVERWGVLGGRFFTLLMSLATMILSACLAYRMSVPCRRSAIWNRQSCAAMLALILIGINSYQSYFTSIVKTYSLTSLFVVSGFLMLSFTEGRFGWVRAVLAGAFFSLAAGVRTSTVVLIPVVFVMLLWVLFYCRMIRRDEYEGGDCKSEKVLPDHVVGPLMPFGRTSVLAGFAFGSLVTLCLIFLPFLFKAPEGFKFGLFDYHLGREVGGIGQILMLKGGSLLRLLASYFVPFSLLVVISLHVIFHKTTFSPSRTPKSLFLLAAVVLSASAVAVVQILPDFPYDDYQVNIFPLFAISLAVYLSWVLAPELLHICAAVFFLSVASAISSPQVTGWFVIGQDRLWVKMREKPQIEVLRQVGRNIRDLAGEGSELLTQDVYLAVEAGLDVPHGLEIGPFSYMPEWTTEKAEAYNVVNREMMVDIIENSRAPVAAVSRYGFSVESPAVKELSGPEQFLLREALNKKYNLFRELEPFGQGDTKLEVYTRK